MSALMDSFKTTNHNDYTWPYPISLLSVPSKPPVYLPRSHPSKCICQFHTSETDMNRYKHLLAKEQELRNNIVKINHEMTRLLSNMIDKSPSIDDTMKSIYQITYANKEVPLTNYKSLMAAIDSPVGSPIEPAITELKDGYRDPTKFRHSVAEEPTIKPVESLDFTRAPEMYSAWSKPFTGRTEYMDTISKLGRSNLQNRKQYLEPQPSTRRRWGNQCL